MSVYRVEIESGPNANIRISNIKVQVPETYRPIANIEVLDPDDVLLKVYILKEEDKPGDEKNILVYKGQEWKPAYNKGIELGEREIIREPDPDDSTWIGYLVTILPKGDPPIAVG